LWGVAQKERALKEVKDEMELKQAYTDNAAKVVSIMQNLPVGQTITIDGTDYTGLSREGFQTGSEDDGTDTTVWAVDPVTGQMYTKKLAGVSAKDGWTWKENNGVGLWINEQTQSIKVGYNTNSPGNGMPGTSGSFSVVDQTFPDDSYGGQCGRFVNELTGIGMGDYFSQKMTLTDSAIGFGEGQMPPQCGDVFVMPISGSDYGHTGIVTGATRLDDGTYQLDILDSNWDKDERVDRHQINSSQITGYARPGLTSKYQISEDELSQALSDYSKSDTAGGSTYAAMSPEDQDTVDAVMNGTLSLSSISVKGNRQEMIGRAVDEQRQTLLDAGDFTSYMASTAGGRDVSDTEVANIAKSFTVLDQINDLNASLSGLDTGPLLGVLRSNNPYDVKAQAIKAQLQAIIPSLARGTYGEVGVLTDADIQNYAQTLPNLTQPQDLQKAVLAMTVKTIQRSLENKIKSLAAARRDVSGYSTLYADLQRTADSLLGSIGSGTTSGAVTPPTPEQESVFGGLFNSIFGK